MRIEELKNSAAVAVRLTPDSEAHIQVLPYGEHDPDNTGNVTVPKTNTLEFSATSTFKQAQQLQFDKMNHGASTAKPGPFEFYTFEDSSQAVHQLKPHRQSTHNIPLPSSTRQQADVSSFRV